MESPGRGQAFAGINVTPMADIMIVILVIFMVVTTFITEGVPVSLPKASHATKGRRREVVVAITRSEATLVNDLGVCDPQDLEATLRKALDAMPGGARVVSLRADGALPYDVVRRVLEVCHRVGVDEITLVTGTGP